MENGRTVLPVLTWRRMRKEFSSGRTWNHRSPATIVLSAGTDPQDAKRVLVHELAHWLNPSGREDVGTLSKAHSPQFYEIVRRLYRRFRIPVREAMAYEAEYYPGFVARWRNYKRKKAHP
jgi:hypothetical protein